MYCIGYANKYEVQYKDKTLSLSKKEFKMVSELKLILILKVSVLKLI